MFLLITRFLLWLFVIWLLWVIFKKIVPAAYYTYLGIFALVVLAFLIFFEPDNSLSLVAWNILSFVLKPLGLALVLIGSAVLGKKGDVSKKGITSITIAFWVLFISSLPLFPNSLYQRFIEEDAQTLITQTADQGAGTIVLLGQGTTQPQLPGRTQIQLTDAGNLVSYTADLYRQLGAPAVIVSAGRRIDLPTAAGNQVEANDIQTLLEQQGVASGNIIIDPDGVNIRSSALSVANILENTGLPNRVVLVASATQIYRASQAFEDLGISVVPRPTNFVTFDFPNAGFVSRLQIQEFVPSIDGLRRTTSILDEYFATMYYFLRGWLAPIELVRPNG
ncbi:MAG: YdcF family protein [Cyanobacteriota bacterium]|nr:YdcF family protein [Cyanobacteriota bacterium]